MPAYTSAVAPGVLPVYGSFTHLDGTEVSMATGFKGAVFQRGSNGGSDNGTSWFISGCSHGSTIQIQGANQNIDSQFCMVPEGLITPDASGNGCFTDTGRALYYRAVVASFVSGDIPVVIAQR